MTAATIKLYLPEGEAKRLRTAEISNWTGKAIAAPRTELEQLLGREELEKAGVYILSGVDSETGKPLAYIGEAEVIRERLKQHKAKEFWVSAVVFVSKDENLTKAHIRYLEGRLISEAEKVGRFTLENTQSGGSRLPECDRADMEVFLSRVRQLLPVLGFDILTPIAEAVLNAKSRDLLYCKNKGAEATGRRTSEGFVVFKNSTAVVEERPSASVRHPFVLSLRKQLLADGSLVKKGDFFVFTKDVLFASPSAGSSIIHSGGTNGWKEWKTEDGKTLRELDTDV